MKIVDIGLNVFEPGATDLEVFITLKDDDGTETMRRLSDFLDFNVFNMPAKQ